MGIYRCNFHVGQVTLRPANDWQECGVSTLLCYTKSKVEFSEKDVIPAKAGIQSCPRYCSGFLLAQE